MGWTKFLLYNIFGYIPRNLTIAGDEYYFSKIVLTGDVPFNCKFLIYNPKSNFNQKKLVLDCFGCVVSIDK